MFNFLLAFFHLIFASVFTPSFPFTTLHHHIKISPQPTVEVTITPAVSQEPYVSESPGVSPYTGSTPTPTMEVTITPTPTVAVTPTEVPIETVTPYDTPTLTPTVEVTPTVTLSPTETPTPTATSTPTITVAPTASITATPTASPTPTLETTPTATPTPAITMTPTASPTPTIAVTPTASPTPTLEITPTATSSPTPTATPIPTPANPKVGNDISWPQCNNSFPSGQAFGIVGINGGLATTTNPCLSTQLLWAGQSLGTANQAKVQLYVNTGNPGDVTPLVASWPQNNTDPLGNTSPNPYGTCDGTITTACAWQYGWNRAVDDIQHKFIPAAVSANVDAVPSDYPLWLDVETTNSWESGSSDALMRNRVDLEAMVTYFQSIRIQVGIYSTNYQWGVIVGSVPSNSNLNGLANWRPGASDLTGAQANCSLSPLTPGGAISMTQFTTNFDNDYSCL